MNLAQHHLYWREWKAVRAWLIAHGRTPKQADAERGKIAEKALGYARSMSEWKTWTNLEVDKVLAAFRAIHDGGNLEAQLRAPEQPNLRKMEYAQRAFAACAVWIQGDDEGHTATLISRYLNGVAMRVCQKPFHTLDERQTAKIMGIVEKHAQREREKDAERVAAADGAEKDQPF